MSGLNKDGDALIGPLNPEGLIKQFQGDARLMPQNIVALSREVLRLRAALAPFAAVADEFDEREDDNHEVWIDAGPERLIREAFRLRMFRAARTSLQPIT